MVHQPFTLNLNSFIPCELNVIFKVAWEQDSNTPIPTYSILFNETLVNFLLCSWVINLTCAGELIKFLYSGTEITCHKEMYLCGT